MKNLIVSWLFFTSLMLFLLTAAMFVPDLLQALLGDTQTQLQETVTHIEQEAQEVWAEFIP